MLQAISNELELHPPSPLQQMTYYHFNLKSRSQIDYILTSPSLAACKNHCILEREPLNVSAHDPVQVTLVLENKLQTPTEKNKTLSQRPSWERIDLHLYQQLAHDSLESLLPQTCSLPIEELISEVEAILKMAEEKASPPLQKKNPK